MNTKILEYLIAIADEKSITKAAAKFYLAQPSLSHHVSNVEKEIGCKLFYRSGRELHLTDAGAIYINGARAILAVERQAMEQLKILEASQSSYLHIFCHPEFQMFLEHKLLPEFFAQHKELPLTFVPTDYDSAIQKLLKGEGNLAIFPASEKDIHTSLKTTVLHEDNLALAFSSKHPLASEAASPNPILLQKYCFYLHEKGTNLRYQEEQLLTRLQLAPELICSVSDYKTLANVIADSTGCGILPYSYIKANRDTLCFANTDNVQPFRILAISSPICNTDLLEIQRDLLNFLESRFSDSYTS